jgi:sulfopropanediol 3-dehydrogenase
VVEYLKQGAPPPHEAGDEVRRTVSEMLARIERDGAAAVRHYSRTLDGWDPPSFLVGPHDVAAAERELGDDLRDAIAFAQEQVAGFARRQLATMQELEVETLPGVVLGHRHIPVGAVGSYIPGGRYPMLASAFMTVLVPKVAGVTRVAACAPPRGGTGIHPAMLYAMATSGADQLICLGGVQALAALAFGLEELEPVDMIVGAGNAYVAEAKRQLFGKVGIDLLAGPTEILVIADSSADPDLVAADLLGQAEHGPTSPAVCITTSRSFGRRLLACVDGLLETWPTADVAGEAWRAHGTVAVASSRDEAVELANRYASEHVEIQGADDEVEFYVERLRNYGSLFVGEHATVAYGDKAIGTNHVLPTSGAARYTGGLWVGKFLRTVTHQRVTAEGTLQVASAVARICEAEQFLGHRETATIRLRRAAAPGLPDAIDRRGSSD